MAKVKYYYDSENLAYRKIKTKKSKKIGYIVLFLLAAALFGFLGFLALLNAPFFVTPKDKIQAREIENLKTRYSILNKKMDLIDEVVDNLEDRDNNLYRIYFNANPIADNIRKSGICGKNRYKELEGFNNSDLVINTSKRVDILVKELVVQSKTKTRSHSFQIFIANWLNCWNCR